MEEEEDVPRRSLHLGVVDVQDVVNLVPADDKFPERIVLVMFVHAI